jgi:SAM-dependent methyltransferase
MESLRNNPPPVIEASLGVAPFPEIPLAAGSLDILEFDASSELLTVSGWMILAGQEFGRFEVFVNGESVGTAQRFDRPDVWAVYKRVDASEVHGFGFTAPVAAVRFQGWVWVDIIAFGDVGPATRLTSLFLGEIETYLPVPPVEYMQRTINASDPRFYLVGGMVSFGAFVDQLFRHGDLASVQRYLDWGCGCGRITGFFSTFTGIAEVRGCDIDPQTIAWCRENHQRGRFELIDPHPPMALPSGSFDLVTAYSVFTHLDREVQREWLAEMRRILVTGGLFLASIHGTFAASTGLPRSARAALRRDGISDATRDPALAGIAPDDYYRATFQTTDYTLAEWGKYLEVVAVIEKGMNHWQDLVVMRKR